MRNTNLPYHFVASVENTPPCVGTTHQESLRHANGGFFVSNAQQRARHAVESLATSA